MNLRSTLAVLAIAAASQVFGAEYLVRFNGENGSQSHDFVARNGGQMELVSREGNLYKWTSDANIAPSWDANVAYVQQNHTYRLFESPSLTANRKALLQAMRQLDWRPGDGIKVKPEIQQPPIQASGTDPLLQKAWGMFMIGADQAWNKTSQGKEIVVAVTDTGADYNHPDLIHNIWRNKGETANGIDDDKNGYIDDLVGWDFAVNDNKPFDLTKSLMEILLQGGNPGHGTHVSGVVGARLNNGLGTAGVAPQVKIMPLRFITEEGQGSTENAVKAIDYAVANGASVINASWGGEAGQEDDTALKDALHRAEAKGVIFVAAAGNGRVNPTTQKPAGFDNDSDPKPMVPASWNFPNMVAVAAIDSNQNLAEFSNWGKKSCLVAAPGVKILSTVPGGEYQDTIIDLGEMLKATWDGTSMASPFVSGSLAVIWSQSKSQAWQAVKQTLLDQTAPIAALSSKIATGGRIELRKLGQ